MAGEFSKGFKVWAMESILGSRIKLQLTWFHTTKEVKTEFQGFYQKFVCCSIVYDRIGKHINHNIGTNQG